VPGAALLLICAACSPASYAVRQRAAERALIAAEGADAVVDKAPYELWLARLYLVKAREEAGQAHYALARQLLATAQQNAVLARKLASVRSRAEEPRASIVRSRAEEPRASIVRSRAEEPRASAGSAFEERVDSARLAHLGSARVREAAP
jgi:hypothetical protein